jgi:8-oxo-dGTP pyrophosphatase MutT (NUDIX family)
MLRDSRRGPQLLMVKRREGDVFGGSFTFPGGVLDADEHVARSYCDGVRGDDANSLLHVADGGLDFYSAAIRELFEETGVLLARRGGVWAVQNAALQALRKQVDSASLAWPDFLRKQNLRMACDAIHYFAHWETPLGRPNRWSTRFFIARIPHGQEADHDDNELTEIRWLTAAEALSAGRSGDMQLPFPTIATLKSCAEFSTVTALLDWAATISGRGVEKILPTEQIRDGKTTIVLPGCYVADERSGCE